MLLLQARGQFLRSVYLLLGRDALSICRHVAANETDPPALP